jgi:ketosteroid isomerase-like protein/ABC-type Zn2+ transport system substrate-binding protein/surface adhesin
MLPLINSVLILQGSLLGNLSPASSFVSRTITRQIQCNHSLSLCNIKNNILLKNEKLYAKSDNHDDDNHDYDSPERINNNSNNNNSRDNNKNENKKKIEKPPTIQLSDAEFDLAVRKAQAQAKIDLILNDPDGPFDLSSELQKVTGGISPPLISNSPEYNLEQKVYELESSLYDAISKGDYDTAQSKKVEISQMHLDDCGFVLAANAAFYKAFSEKDFDSMNDLWLHDASAYCIHPSQLPLIGAKNVLNSWKQMFASGNSAFQRNYLEPTNIRLSVKGCTAIVTCDEEVYTRRFVRGRPRIQRLQKSQDGKSLSPSSSSSSSLTKLREQRENGISTISPRKDGMELVNKLVATNIFRKVGGKWYMVHHHSAFHSDSEASKNALNPKGTASIGGKLTSSSTTPQNVQGLRNNNNDDNLSAEKILGIPGHEGLFDRNSAKSSSPQPGEGKVVKRIFTGSLSDLLGGGLNDILGGSASGDGRDVNESSSIIFGNFAGDDDEDEEDDDEDLEDEEEDEDEDDDDDDDDEDLIINFSGTKKNINSGLLLNGGESKVIRTGGNNRIITSKLKSNKEDSNAKNQLSSTESIRKECIASLRRLADQGSISQKQKRVLLTDIIMCSSREEQSMVEVAYKVLCGDNDFDDDNDDENQEDAVDIAEEDFADQCRIFASILPETPNMQAFGY